MTVRHDAVLIVCSTGQFDSKLDMHQRGQNELWSATTIHQEDQQGLHTDTSEGNESRGNGRNARAPRHPDDHTQRQSRKCRFTWLRRTRLSFFPHPLVVENKGNVARDHLSAERTFLAYIRTSLICLTAGVALVQLLTATPSRIPLHFERFGKALGSVTEALGITILIIAVIRFFSVQRALLDGKYPAANLLIWLISIALVVITLVLFGLMLGITLD